jgi:hypothetical protein
MIFCAGLAASAQLSTAPPDQSPAAAAAQSATRPLVRPQIDPHSKSVIAGTSFLLPAPIYPVSQREDAIYTVEYVFNFARYNYAPAVTVRNVNRAHASYATPEDAFTAFYSAIQAGDYEWMLASWDTASQKYIADTDKSEGHDKAYWIGLWKERYADRKIQMLQRIESGLYVLIFYRITDPSTDKVVEEDTLVLNLENKKWLATQALAADPLEVMYPELKPRKENEVLLPQEHRAPNSMLPPGVVPLSRDQAQELFLKEYPRSDKDGVKVVER